MVVVDASVIAEVLVGRRYGRALGAALREPELIAPQLLAVEVLSVLRRWVRHGTVSAQRAEAALIDLEDLGIVWMDLPPLLGEAWSLRESLTAYDAVYVALAESLRMSLVTLDTGILAAAPEVAVQAGTLTDDVGGRED